MKDFTETECRDNSLKAEDFKEHLAFCLKKLFDDTTHTLNQEIVRGLTFEELIGTLLEGELFTQYADVIEDAFYKAEELFVFQTS